MPRDIKLVDAFLDDLGVLLPTPVLCDIQLLANGNSDAEPTRKVEKKPPAQPIKKRFSLRTCEENMGKTWGKSGENLGKYVHRDVEGRNSIGSTSADFDHGFWAKSNSPCRNVALLLLLRTFWKKKTFPRQSTNIIFLWRMKHYPSYGKSPF